MAFTYTWQTIAAAVADKVFGYAAYNKLRTNFLALKERYEHGHLWSDGTHKQPGSVAYAAIACNGVNAPSIVASSSFNVASVIRVSAGLYDVTLTNNVLQYGTVVASLCANGGAVVDSIKGFTVYAISVDVNSVYIYVYNDTPELADIPANGYISFAIFNTIAGA